MKKVYTEDSIQSLTPLEFTRLRPGVYVGSTEYSTQLLIEIISNAVDEYCIGHGDTIQVNISADNVITVQDNAQGFLPNAKRLDGKTILEASYSVLNTSGKYTDDGVYEGVALGLNGIGSKLANYLSNWLEVTSWRDGKYEKVKFNEGIFESRDIGDWKNEKSPSGTLVSWKPSAEFFTNAEVDTSAIVKLFNALVCLCPGLKILYKYKDNPQTTFYSKNGLIDFIDESITSPEIIKNRLKMNYISGKNKIDLALTFTEAYSSTIVPYVNTGLTDSGPHITQIKTILTREMNKFFREKKWLKDKDDNLTGEDCQEGLYLVFNIMTSGVSYDAQTKSRIVKIDMSPFTESITEAIKDWLEKNEKGVKAIADKALSARKAREAAKKAREVARNSKIKEKGLKAKLALSDKFVDCKSKDPAQRDLLLVEGLSAAGSVIEARNPLSDCIYMLRGKILSSRKTTLEKILANQELSDIIKVIGAGLGEDFDVNKMNFNKIVITSDANCELAV